MKKNKYLVGHNYGMGGVPLYIYANSFSEIQELYPHLQLVDEGPWLSEKMKLDAEKWTYNISDEPTGSLLSIS